MSDEDNIFREVEEDMRRERLAALWDRYGIYVISAAVLIVVIVGGYNVNNWWQKESAAADGETYYQAVQLLQEEKPSEALDVFSQLAGDGGEGYESLSRLRMAAIHLEQGREQDALGLYDQVASSGADQMLRDFATLQAAALRLDDADLPEMRERLEGLNKDTNPWRYSAQELLALSAFRSGNTSESEKLFSQIIGDPSAPAEIRRRAEAMMALLVKAPEKVSSADINEQESRTQ